MLYEDPRAYVVPELSDQINENTRVTKQKRLRTERRIQTHSLLYNSFMGLRHLLASATLS